MARERPRYFRVVNFEKFQHYRDRTPPWIKLHASVLRKYEFTCLDDAAKAHLMLIWLLASRMKNRIPYDPVWVADQISAKVPVDLDELQELEFIEIEEADSETLAPRYQDACLETETERETEAEGETEAERARGEDASKYPTPEATFRNRFEHATDFTRLRAVYPARAGSQSWHRARIAATTRMKEGHAFEEFIAGAERYARYCDATGTTNTQYVMAAVKFLGEDKHFLEPWDLPKEPETLFDRNRAAAQRVLDSMEEEEP